MAAKRKPGTHLKHVFASPLVRIEGKRAFSICHVNLESRDEIDGHAVDLRVWFRFFDLLRKEEDGKWRIHNRTAVYEKDRIDPVDPRGVPAALFANMDLSGFVPASDICRGMWRGWDSSRVFARRADAKAQERCLAARRGRVTIRGNCCAHLVRAYRSAVLPCPSHMLGWLCVPKIRFSNIGGEVHREPAVK
jgi:hypothetical protein